MRGNLFPFKVVTVIKKYDKIRESASGWKKTRSTYIQQDNLNLAYGVSLIATTKLK